MVIPNTVEAIIEQFLGGIAQQPACNAALAALAWLGSETPQHVWAEVAALSESELQQVSTQLEHLGVVQGQQFIHPLYRELTLRQLTPAQRQELAVRSLGALHDHPRQAAQFVVDAGLSKSATMDWFMQAAQAARAGGDPLQEAHFKGAAAQYAPPERQVDLYFAAASSIANQDLPKTLQYVETILYLAPEYHGAMLLGAKAYASQGQRIEQKFPASSK